MTQNIKTVAPLIEAGDRYTDLVLAARAAAETMVKTPAGLTGPLQYIHGAAQALLASPEPTDAPPLQPGCAAKECLQKLVDAWPSLVSGETNAAESVFSGNPGLWKRAMTEWPMGNFAILAANFLLENNLAGGAILELGAGVGSCSERIAHAAGSGYIRSDLSPFLLARQRIPGSVARYDFNERGSWTNLDAIFAVNAFHCAADKERSLGYLFDMLRPGGVLLLGEGAPHTDAAGTPWVLNIFFGLFQGWWDVGGFLARNDWLDLLGASGFTEQGFVPAICGQHDLGGIVWGVKP